MAAAVVIKNCRNGAAGLLDERVIDANVEKEPAQLGAILVLFYQINEECQYLGLLLC
ncbi:MAG TPA: hypothetical protein PK271_04765 [Hyphomicrobium sp.]|uniref:hypothetical protein n=1 Tax=Hyphomicrobium sp. TaxID=82 RepID=UPI002B789B21|nr:hypothetical protein [Hyphomicrobium sp.]HRN87893.1 hypothetical protein [Hyphomicrobium sp.]